MKHPPDGHPDHGFPRGCMPDDDPFDRFKNERDYIAQSGNMKTTVAAMDWAVAEIERLRGENKTLFKEHGIAMRLLRENTATLENVAAERDALKLAQS